jgi:N-dimethylarginine dimethylaminohydrolase
MREFLPTKGLRMKRFLMCYPKNFLVNYEINPWMKNNIGTVDNLTAVTQWEELHKQLLSVGNEIVLMRNQSAEVPDLVFTANAAMKTGKAALIANFANAERKPESELYKELFESIGFTADMRCIEQNINFEGAGDILIHKSSNTYVLAYGFRTDKKALDMVQGFLKDNNSSAKVVQVKLVDPRFYHLDTCFCPLDNGDILYHPAAFSEASLLILQEIFKDKLIEVGQEDAQNFACNAVSIDRFIYMNKASGPLLKVLLDKGFIIVGTPLSEFLKAGGSAKCLTMEI